MYLYTSMRRYMIVSSANAMLPVAKMKLNDHRFLLMGMIPLLRENSDNPPDTRPVINAHASHLVTLVKDVNIRAILKDKRLGHPFLSTQIRVQGKNDFAHNLPR